MKRIHRIILTYFFFVALWAFVFFGYSAQYFKIDPEIKKYIDASPALLLLSLGVYAVLSVVVGVLTFGDAGNASERLAEDVKRAKLGLAKKGFNF
jgi:Dolichol-phosphate mannosyltransferase subunit 3 (DPM3)